MQSTTDFSPYLSELTTTTTEQMTVNNEQRFATNGGYTVAIMK